jgi:LmbE family N-acetylglucosaminyl deacetylase
VSAVPFGNLAAGLRRVLVLGAHPDDIEIGCGATLLRLLEEQPGLEMSWCVFSGAGARAEEARTAAAGFLGGGEHYVRVEDFRDGFLPWSGGAVKEVFEELKDRVDPDLVFTHRCDDAHQDHRLVGELTWQTFRRHLVLEYEIPKYEGDLGAPNLFVAVPEETAARKVELLMKCFPSQLARRWFEPDTFWSLMRLRGLESNAASRYAEGFYVRKLVLS